MNEISFYVVWSPRYTLSPLIIPLNWLAWPKFAFKVMKNGGHIEEYHTHTKYM
jgi:hypothetical protein